VEAIRDAMTAHSMHYGWELHEDACRVLTNTGRPTCQNMPTPVISLVVAGLMRRVRVDARVDAPERVDARVAALAAFTAAPENIGKVSDAGGVKALLLVLRWPGAGAQVCALACRALASLAPHGENGTYICEASGMALVLRVFAQHRREPPLQTSALALLACLVAGSPGLKADFCQRGGRDILRAALADPLGRENTRVAEAIILECSAEAEGR